MSNPKHAIALAIFIIPVLLSAQNAVNIKGTILDKSSGEPLPFATVNLKGTAIGTISNADGDFTFRCPNQGTLLVSFIGYQSFEIPIQDINSEFLIAELTPTFIELTELVVRPLSAEQYLRRVVRKFDDNYAKTPFETRAYYREKFTENNAPIQYTEAFFKSFYPDFRQDSSQHQLLLYRRTEDLQDIAFMASRRDKKIAKEQKKALKRGEEYDNETDQNIIQMAFGGPEEVIAEDPVIAPENFLDTLLFKKFRYEYGENSSYQGRKLLSINFETRGKVEHVKQSGKILIDEDSDAIVSVEFTGKFVIPLWARPLLFTFGLAIKEPVFTKRVRYQQVGEKWYPQSMLVQGGLGLTKRYILKSNDKSAFYIEQVFNVQSIDLKNPTEISKEHLYDPDDDLEEQLVTEDGVEWSKVNVLQVENQFAGSD